MDNLDYDDDPNGLGNMDIEDEDMVNEYNNDNDINQSSKNDGKEKAPNIQIKPAGMKQKRRSKNDSLGRDYVCGCGKTYLSYPALYTHIKTKHNGKTPDGTNANQVQNGRGRGRPRKNFLINEDSQRKKRELRDGTVLDEKFDEIKELYNYYDKASFRKSIISEETYNSIYNGLGLLSKSTDALNDFIDLSPDIYDKSTFSSYMKIYEKVKFLYENPHNLKTVLNSSSAEFSEKFKINIYKNITCDDLFGIYLNYISNNINAQLYKSTIILLRHYRDCMNNLGWEIFEKYEDYLEEKTEYDYCSIKNGENLPHICNDFLNKYLPHKLPAFDTHIASVIICEFCDWLYRRKFTHIRVTPILENQI